MSGKRVMVVGQATGRLGGRPWNGNTVCSLRLYRWLGVRDHAEFSRSCRAVNVARYAGRSGKGDAYEVDGGMVSTAMALCRDYDLVVLVGKVAQRAVMGVEEPRMLWKFGRFCGVPHPSGINLQLNGGGDERVKKAVRRWLRGLR